MKQSDLKTAYADTDDEVMDVVIKKLKQANLTLKHYVSARSRGIPVKITDNGDHLTIEEKGAE